MLQKYVCLTLRLNRNLLLLLLDLVILDRLFYCCFEFVFIYADVALVSFSLYLWLGVKKTMFGCIMRNWSYIYVNY